MYLNTFSKFTKESEFVKTRNLPKAHNDSFPFLYCLSVPYESQVTQIFKYAFSA